MFTTYIPTNAVNIVMAIIVMPFPYYIVHPVKMCPNFGNMLAHIVNFPSVRL